MSSGTASRPLSRLSRRANAQLAENIEQPACQLLPGEVRQDVFARAAALTVLPIDRAADRDGCGVDMRLPPVGTREERLQWWITSEASGNLAAGDHRRGVRAQISAVGAVIWRDQSKPGGGRFDHRLIPSLAMGQADVVRRGRIESRHFGVRQQVEEDLDRSSLPKRPPDLALQLLDLVGKQLEPARCVAPELEKQERVIVRGGGDQLCPQ